MFELGTKILQESITSLKNGNFTLKGFFSLCIMNMVAKASEMAKYGLSQEDYDPQTGDPPHHLMPDHYNIRIKFFRMMFAIIRFKKRHATRLEVFKAIFEATNNVGFNGEMPPSLNSGVDLLSYVEGCLFKIGSQYPQQYQSDTVIDISRI
ncbi:MAG TPA: hypothetical protein VGC17_06510 [Lactovum miscens]|uniref:hypothetical protein n=1 Tax=Lactovum miscens TaxID=190387 RepID=UPI002ED7FF02